MPKLYPYQNKGIARINEIMDAPHSRGVLLADEMGLGKTAQAIRVADMRLQPGGRVIVVCPASLKMNWRNEILKWSRVERPIHIYEGRSDEKFARLPEPGWHIVNYDIVSWESAAKWRGSQRWELAIIDEAHFIKNPQAKRSKAVLGVKAESRIFITGTPIANRPIEIWPILHFLMHDDPVFRSRHQFGCKYCAGHKTKFGWNYNGHSNLKDLKEKLQRVMVRRRKSEVLDDLPAKTRQVIELPPTADMARKLDKLTLEYRLCQESVKKLSESASRAKDAGDDAAFKAASLELGEAKRLAFSQMAHARQELAEEKADSVAEYAMMLMENEGQDKIVIAYHHRVMAANLEEIIKGKLKDGVRVLKIDGSVDPSKRVWLVDEFNQSKKPTVLLAQISAAGVGLNMTGGSCMLFAELDWTPANVAQMEDRLHRIGQKDNVTIQYLCLANSMDAMIAKSIAKKVEVITRAIDGGGKDSKEMPKIPQGDEAVAIGNRMTIMMKEAAHLGVFELAKRECCSAVHQPIAERLARLRSPMPYDYGRMLWICHFYRRSLPGEIIKVLPIKGNNQLELKLV